MVFYIWLDSPIERLLLTSDGTALIGLYMSAYEHGPEMGADWKLSEHAQPLVDARRQLDAYFEGRLTSFNLPLRLIGTEFQKRVWDELMAIEYGTTISYGELARRIGNANGSRAVGAANGRNPISIIVPCHRVIGANGTLVGYGGGLPRKKALLAFESSVTKSGPHPFPGKPDPAGDEHMTGHTPQAMQTQMQLL